MENKKSRSTFSGSIGFVLAAAGSAVGLGNIWRFPYLAARDGGGVFLLCYLILALTFGFALLTAEIAIGRKTRQSPLTAYGAMHKKFKWLGVLACAVPALILPYYCVIGGWVLNYMMRFFTAQTHVIVQEGYFAQFIASPVSPIIWFSVYLLATVYVVYKGVNAGIERLSKVLMPVLLVLIIGIACFSLTLSHTDAEGVTRTGLQGLMIYAIPNFRGMTIRRFMVILMDALGQLFYSVSVAMGIMITYGSYVKKDTNLIKSVNHIELFDTAVAFIAGLMIVPSVYTFMGTEGMASGPSLMFISLPKVFEAMGSIGTVVGAVFFVMVAFAALTSSVSILEAVVSSLIDRFHISRKKAVIYCGVYAMIVGVVVCLGYNAFYFDCTLPNDTHGQILDVLDYISNYCLMPIVALATCIMVGWVLKPESITDEVRQGGFKFSRERLYIVMIRVVAPIMLLLLLCQSLGLISL